MEDHPLDTLDMRDLPYSDRSLAIACIRGREAIVRRFHPLLASESLTEAQWRVLRVLNDYSPLNLTDLCRSCCIHKVSMTRIIRTLADKGLVHRVRQQADRRAVHVSLTSQGADLMGRMTPAANSVYARVIEDLGEEQARQLLSLLRKLSKIESIQRA
jgi:homoprotocatechuate degradation regulator HpaR